MTLTPMGPSTPPTVSLPPAEVARFSSFEEAAFLGVPRLLEAADVTLTTVDVPTLAAELVQHQPATFFRDGCWLLPALAGDAVRAAAARHARPPRS